tara:strand:+ start:1226 stop:1426 length:201 start_codon:yes stop_codon:yes gene_type:complete
MSTKKWYVREVNSSRYVSEPYVYWTEGESIQTWTTEITKARAWRTKKEATAFISEALGNRGEVHGE